MLTDALGTYAAALIVIVVSTAIGSGILAAAGARSWSPTSAVIGLAAASVIAWWAVRLPGHGLTALLVLLVAAIAAGAFAALRLSGLREGLGRCAPIALVALAAVSIPFVAEGHFGVLGTGFNVDMSQHLFAADWLADPTGLSPSLIRNGYPLGPHALAVAANEVTGELSIAFTGITIAVPVLAASRRWRPSTRSRGCGPCSSPSSPRSPTSLPPTSRRAPSRSSSRRPSCSDSRSGSAI